MRFGHFGGIINAEHWTRSREVTGSIFSTSGHPTVRWLWPSCSHWCLAPHR